ncbi:MAG: heme exporter protein CcmB [Acidobacteria bacterium]|nr:heme exporter protein CcmB [Acidobacteriota bacterium]
MMFFKVLFLIFWKDIRDEIRRKENLFASLFFAVLSLLLFHFSIDSSDFNFSEQWIGFFWLIVIFAGTIFMQNIFKKEEENGTFFALLLAPVDRSAVYLAKFLVCCVFLVFLEFFLFLLSFFFFNLQFFDSFMEFLFIASLVNIGFSALGVLVSSLLTNLKGLSILYPLLLYPLLFPLFMAAINVTRFLMNSSLALSNEWLRLIILFDIIFLVASSVLFESAVED